MRLPAADYRLPKKLLDFVAGSRKPVAYFLRNAPSRSLSACLRPRSRIFRVSSFGRGLMGDGVGLGRRLLSGIDAHELEEAVRRGLVERQHVHRDQGDPPGVAERLLVEALAS
jgi:hypothetical protein